MYHIIKFITANNIIGCSVDIHLRRTAAVGRQYDFLLVARLYSQLFAALTAEVIPVNCWHLNGVSMLQSIVGTQTLHVFKDSLADATLVGRWSAGRHRCLVM